ncbi:hypothetical protein LINPERHAP2_LOCUS23398 [Linum perenne]
MRQHNSSLTWDPAYEVFVTRCRVREVVRVLGATPTKDLVTTLIESWVIVGSLLLVDWTGDHMPEYLLTLLGDPDVATTFSSGSAILAWLYRQMGRVAFFIGGNQKGTGDLGRFNILV